MFKRKILIIDDEENFCKLIKINLELEADFKVSTATDGRQGIGLAKREQPDLILLDILMPGMDGLEVLKKLKSDESTIEIPVIMLTAVGSEAVREKALTLYDEEYITKPVEFADLKIKIDEVLKRKRL